MSFFTEFKVMSPYFLLYFLYDFYNEKSIQKKSISRLFSAMEKHFVYCKKQTEFLTLFRISDETIPFSTTPRSILYDLHLVFAVPRTPSPGPRPPSPVLRNFLSRSNNLGALSINFICQMSLITPSAREIHNTTNNSRFLRVQVNRKRASDCVLYPYEDVF